MNLPEWMGLHNPERHEADASDPRVKWCPCFTAMTEHVCAPDRPCPCCVEAEAERLRALVQRVREVCDLWQRRYDSSIRHPTDIPAIPITAVLRALDGAP